MANGRVGKITVMKCHQASNSYDGYAPHNHIMVLTITPGVYMTYILNRGGTIYPQPDIAEDIVVNPWLVESVRKYYQKATGYDWGADSSAEFPGIYSLSNPGTKDRSFHDGIDVPPSNFEPGRLIASVKGSATNAKGFHGTADVFEVDASQLLMEGQCWLRVDGRIWVRGSLRDGASYFDAPYRKVLEASGKTVLWSQTELSAYYEG